MSSPSTSSSNDFDANEDDFSHSSDDYDDSSECSSESYSDCHFGDGQTVEWTGKELALKNDILKVIKPYSTTENKPPFSAGELFVMALLCSHGSGTISHVVMWICSNFPYCQSKAIQKYALAVRRREEPSDIVRGLHNVVNNWTVPLSHADRNSTVTSRSRLPLFVSCEAGRVYLRRWLEPERKGTFPFLRLPLDLRLAIYELALSFPKSGFRFKPCTFPGYELSVVERESDPGEISWDRSNCNPKPRKPGRPRRQNVMLCSPTLEIPKNTFRKVLALLLTNRQIYQEALPIFYNLNHFHFHGDLAGTMRIFNKLPSRHMEHLGHIDFEWSCIVSNNVEDPKKWLDRFSVIMERFSRVRKLRSLRLRINIEPNNGNLPAEAAGAQQCQRHWTEALVRSLCSRFPGFSTLAVVASRSEKLVVLDGLFEETFRKHIARLQTIDLQKGQAEKRGRSLQNNKASQANDALQAMD